VGAGGTFRQHGGADVPNHPRHRFRRDFHPGNLVDPTMSNQLKDDIRAMLDKYIDTPD